VNKKFDCVCHKEEETKFKI